MQRNYATPASSDRYAPFNEEIILFQWSHNDTWMVTGDHGGYIKYWQSNMNNVKMFQAHKEPVRDVSFSPTDTKFAR